MSAGTFQTKLQELSGAETQNQFLNHWFIRGSESYSCPNTSWLLHLRQVWTLRLLDVQLRQLARVISCIILAQLLDVLLRCLSQVLHIELSLLILLVRYPCVLYTNLFYSLLSQPFLS